MTPDETAKAKQLKTDADAKAFADLFWARRDPTPNTQVNEFRNEFDRRVQYAEQQFGQARKKGSLTDRGRIFIVLGAPYSVQRSNPEGQGTVQTPGMGANSNTIQGYSPRQIWKYDQTRTQVVLGQPTAEVAFIDQYASNDWTMERTARTPIDDLLKRTVQSFVTSPNLTAAPSYQAQAAQPVAPVVAPAPVAPAADVRGTFKTESLRAAVEAQKAAKTNPFKPLGVSWTEMVSPAGDHFVPVQLYISKDAGIAADAVTTFFGTIEDASGTAVAIYEEPATLASSKGDLYFDKSLKLQPGTYRATLGLAGADGKPVIMSSVPMEVKALPVGTADAGISRMVLSSDIHQTDEAALVGAPYAFGRVKIVPKGDRVFSNKEELSYFVEVLNPGIDEGTNLPKLQVRLELIGAPGKDGKPGRTISAPIADTTALPLTGAPGPGQYAVLAGIPLGEMKNPLPPGNYTLRVKVFDQVRKQSWTTEQPLKLVAAPAAAASQ